MKNYQRQKTEDMTGEDICIIMNDYYRVHALLLRTAIANNVLNLLPAFLGRSCTF